MSRIAGLRTNGIKVEPILQQTLTDKQFFALLRGQERKDKRQKEHERFLEKMSIVKLLIAGAFGVGVVYLIGKTNPAAFSYVIPTLISPIILILGAKRLFQKKDKDDFR